MGPSVMGVMRRITGVRGAVSLLAGAALVLGSVACQDVSVSAVPIDVIEVQPTSATLLVGETLEMAFEAYDDRGNRLSGRLVDWGVRDSGVARIGSNGVLVALASGQTVIEARSEGVTGEAALEVLPGPAIALDPTSVDFTAVEGGEDPPPDTVAIENSGEGDLTGLNLGAVQYGEGEPTGWLSDRLTGTSAPAELILEADISRLSDGTYSASVDVQSAEAGNSPQTVSVRLTVEEAPPLIRLDPASWSTEAPEFYTGEAPRETISITNGGGMVLQGIAVDSVRYEQPSSAGWLGWSLEGAEAPTTLTLEAYAWLRPDEPNQRLREGTYRATVFISAVGASNTPATLPVTFRITPLGG